MFHLTLIRWVALSKENYVPSNVWVHFSFLTAAPEQICNFKVKIRHIPSELCRHPCQLLICDCPGDLQDNCMPFFIEYYGWTLTPGIRPNLICQLLQNLFPKDKRMLQLLQTERRELIWLFSYVLGRRGGSEYFRPFSCWIHVFFPERFYQCWHCDHSFLSNIPSQNFCNTVHSAISSSFFELKVVWVKYFILGGKHTCLLWRLIKAYRHLVSKDTSFLLSANMLNYESYCMSYGLEV